MSMTAETAPLVGIILLGPTSAQVLRVRPRDCESLCRLRSPLGEPTAPEPPRPLPQMGARGLFCCLLFWFREGLPFSFDTLRANDTSKGSPRTECKGTHDSLH